MQVHFGFFLLLKENPQHDWGFPKALAMPRIKYPSKARNNDKNRPKEPTIKFSK